MLQGSSLDLFTKYDLVNTNYDKLMIHSHGISQEKQAMVLRSFRRPGRCPDSEYCYERRVRIPVADTDFWTDVELAAKGRFDGQDGLGPDADRQVSTKRGRHTKTSFTYRSAEHRENWRANLAEIICLPTGPFSSQPTAPMPAKFRATKPVGLETVPIFPKQGFPARSSVATDRGDPVLLS